MSILFSEKTGEFYISNQYISYIMKILPDGRLGNLYFGKRIRYKNDYSYLLEGGLRSLAVYRQEGDYFYSQQHTRMEYPESGAGDFREPAFVLLQENGSTLADFRYQSHTIFQGKKGLRGLPALYAENDSEAETLEITMRDSLLGVDLVLSYSVFRDYPVMARSAVFHNYGRQEVVLERAFSASIDLPDAEYEMIQLSGAWARERNVIVRRLYAGDQGIGSRRGISSAEQNPFVAVKRKNADEFSGEVIGFSLIYSGNHMEHVEVDTFGMIRIQTGIHPEGFSWLLKPGESFQTPEAVIVYSEQGINGMSQAFHNIYRRHLVRGVWKEKERPVLINNWEATGAQFSEREILAIASASKEAGAELFVLDDGWFGNRDDDTSGLGDWYVTNDTKLPNGIGGLAEKIQELGMSFGLWIEPEMVNKDSDLYRKHPDWILHVPDRFASPSRNQYVLDFTRSEVVGYIYGLLKKLLAQAPVSYIKWDMNRYLTDVHSVMHDIHNQGKVFHEYILGVYDLYERLISDFPHVLFESCASGGARFDPGMLYYAPQVWTSDNTDAIERIKIQFGTSYVYPLSSMGAHISNVPNQQVGRITPLETRGNVACFGVLGYELDLQKLSPLELQVVKRQIEFYKKHRKLIMEGDFYRLRSPFHGMEAAWIVVSGDKKEALAGFYRIMNAPNEPWIRLRLAGLDEEQNYIINDSYGESYGGDELMHVGMVIKKANLCGGDGDFSSQIFEIKGVSR